MIRALGKSKGGITMSRKNRMNYSNISKPEEPVVKEPDILEEAINDPIEGIVTNCSKLNLRREPSADAIVLRIISEGDSVKILDKDEFWTHVKLPDGLEGYCVNKYIDEV